MITEEEIKKLAGLARIELTEDETKQLSADVSRILSYVEELKQVNTDGLPEIAQVTGLKNALRKDEPTASTSTREELLACAPVSENGYIKVKAVFE